MKDRPPEYEKTVPGMAHWAGTGPLGTTCAGCRFYRGWCQKFRRMIREKRQSKFQLPPTTPSCKYFEPKVKR